MKFSPLISAYPSPNKLSSPQQPLHSKTHTINKNEQPTVMPPDPDTSQRIKKRTFTLWEREYWDSLGQQAEEAEQRGDHFALYSLMTKLKVRKANNTRQTSGPLRATPSQKPSPGDTFSTHTEWSRRRSRPSLAKYSPNPHDRRLDVTNSTPQELKRALQKMKVGKAPGDDGVTVEMLKWAPPSIMDKVITITQHIWQTTTRADPQELVDHWPAEWLTATVIPLWKMKHPKTCKNNWPRKLSVPGVLTTFTSHCTISRKRNPRINRDALWQLLQRRGVPPEFINVM